MLRAAISGDLPEDELYTDRFQSEVLDLCLGCKGCATDCPTGVDLAKLKAEVKHRHHEREGAGLRERVFADAERFFSLGSAFAPLSNWATNVPGARSLFEATLGVARERDLPTFSAESFEEWYDDRGPRIAESTATDRVVLVPDPYANYVYPGVAKAAVRVLEAADVHVRVPEDRAPSGRAAYSLGFLDEAASRARRNVETLAPLVEEGWSVVTVEPSDAAVFQDEYRDLLSGGSRVRAVTENTYGICGYIDRARADERIAFDAPGESLAYHGHCNQKALGTDHHAVGVLRRAGYAVDPLDSTCCGMAGSFGYEAEHYSMSMAIGDMLFEQAAESPGERVVTPGASCRSQFAEVDEEPIHPAEALADALASRPLSGGVS
jgi:Fe-S oxidoreductase